MSASPPSEVVKTQSDFDNTTTSTTNVAVNRGLFTTGPDGDSGEWVGEFDTLDNVSTVYAQPGGFHNWTSGTSLTSGSLENSNDPSIVYDEGAETPYQMLVNDVDNGTVDYYVSSDGENWTLAADDVYSEMSPGDFVQKDGTYYMLAGDGHVWTGDSLDTLSNTSVDTGITEGTWLYDDDTSEWAAVGTGDDWGSSCCVSASMKMYNAGSWDGNWTDEGTIVNKTGDSWGTGDPYLAEIGDQYFLFADKSSSHPDYDTFLWTSDSLSGDASDWKISGTTTKSYGGDPQIIYDGNQWMMFTEFAHSGSDDYGVKYRTSPGPWAGDIGVTVSGDTDGDGTYESSSANHNLTASYSRESAHEYDVDVSQSVDVESADSYQVSMSIADDGGRPRVGGIALESASTTSTYSVNGTVTDSSGNAVGSASVTVTDSSGTEVASTTTASDGTYSVDVSGGDDYTVQVSTSGFTDASKTVTVSSDTTVDITLSASESTYAIDGTVTDTDANAIDGATVELLDSNDNVVDNVTTGSDGSYSITGVKAGDYTVRAEADGYASVRQDVTVDSDTTADLGLLVTDTWTFERPEGTPDHAYLEFNESGTAYVAVSAFNNSTSSWETVVDYETVDVTYENDTVTEQFDLSNHTSEDYTEYRVVVDGTQPSNIGVAEEQTGGGGAGGADGDIPVFVVIAGIGLLVAAAAAVFVEQ